MTFNNGDGGCIPCHSSCASIGGCVGPGPNSCLSPNGEFSETTPITPWELHRRYLIPIAVAVGCAITIGMLVCALRSKRSSARYARVDDETSGEPLMDILNPSYHDHDSGSESDGGVAVRGPADLTPYRGQPFDSPVSPLSPVDTGDFGDSAPMVVSGREQIGALGSLGQLNQTPVGAHDPPPTPVVVSHDHG